MTKEEVVAQQKIVELVDENSAASDSDDEETPEVEETNGDNAGAKQSRGEKKARQIVSKLGLKPVEGINRVVFKRSKNVRVKSCRLMYGV